MIDPKLRKDALRALKLQRSGLKGKAMGERLGCSTQEANRLASTGSQIEAMERAVLTQPERLVILSLGREQIALLNDGEIRSAKSKQVSWRADKASGWAATACRRLRTDAPHTPENGWSPHALVNYSINGYMFLTPAGWAVFHAAQTSGPLFYVGIHHPNKAWPLTLRGARVCISANVLRDQAAPAFIGAEPGNWLLDSGAFTQVARHGGFEQSAADYAYLVKRFAGHFGPAAAVSQDWMCEPFILARTGLTVDDHQRLTVQRFDEIRAHDLGGVYLMPVLQGWAPADYAACVDLYGARLAPGAWVGVGSVCKRQGKPAALAAVLQAIHAKRPDLRLHGFGVKSTALRTPEIRSLLHSADSMAWSYAERRAGRDANNWRAALAYGERL